MDALKFASEPVVVQGFDFNKLLAKDTSVLDAFLASYGGMGFQGTQLHEATVALRKLLLRRHQVNNPKNNNNETGDDEESSDKPFVFFFGFTSNQVSCGNRELIRFVVEHRLVDAIVTTAGGVEEDLLKCLQETHFVMPAKKPDELLRECGVNRIGNLMVPNQGYCAFEDWLTPHLDSMLQEQRTQGVCWTPSKVIRRLGRAIDNPASYLHWAARHDIPVYCPALTDGSLGDMLFFHSFKTSRCHPPKPASSVSPPNDFFNDHLRLDIVEDVRSLNLSAMRAKETGMLILGGGLVKHHLANANLMRNGAEHAVYVNTGIEADGSDAGAGPEEAISWGKIKPGTQAVKVWADASIVFPMLVAGAFLPHLKQVDREGECLLLPKHLDHLYL